MLFSAFISRFNCVHDTWGERQEREMHPSYQLHATNFVQSTGVEFTDICNFSKRISISFTVKSVTEEAGLSSSWGL